MTQLMMAEGSASPLSMAAATVNYFYFGGMANDSQSNLAEIRRQVTWETPGTFSSAYLNVKSNDRATSTFVSRLNAASTNLAISITSSTTGDFSNLTNIDTIAAGDEVAAKISTGSAGTTFNVGAIGVLFSATTNAASRLIAGGNLNITTNNGTFFYTPVGPNSTNDATEARRQVKAKTAGTLANFFVYVLTNGRTSATSVGSRVNSLPGGLAVSIGSAATGFFEDTVNSDTLVKNDLICYFVSTGTGAGESFAPSTMAVDLVTTNNSAQYIAGGGIQTFSAATAGYVPLAGNMTTDTATEANIYIQAGVAMTASDLGCRVQTNAVTAATTINLRINSSTATQSLSISSSTTGFFDDATNTDVILSTDKINYIVSPGATGTTLTIPHITILGTVGGAASQDITCLGISSAEAIGTHIFDLSLLLTGIDGAEAFGTLQLDLAGASQEITCVSIASGEAVGIANLDLNILLASIESGELFGDAILNYNQTIEIAGIDGAEAFGALVITVETEAADGTTVIYHFRIPWRAQRKPWHYGTISDD